MEFVGAEGEEIDWHPAHVHRDLADGLHGIGMEEDAVFAADLRQFGNREDQPGFIVGPHD